MPIKIFSLKPLIILLVLAVTLFLIFFVNINVLNPDFIEKYNKTSVKKIESRMGFIFEDGSLILPLSGEHQILTGLNKLYLKTANDPLFLSHEAPLAIQEEIATTIGYHDEFLDKSGLEDPILPVDFLNQLTNTQRANRAFFNKPNIENASGLMYEYLEAEEAYSENIEMLIKNIEKHFTKDKGTKISGLSSSSSPEMIINNLYLHKKNSRVLKKEIIKRKGFVKADIKKIDFNDEREERIKVASYDRVVRTATGCFSLNVKEEKFTTHEFNIKGQKTRIPLLYGDYFLTKKPDSLGASINDWEPHIYSAPYLCQDLLYYVEVFNAHYFISKFKKPILNNTDLFSFVPVGAKKLEEDIFNSKEVASRDLDRLAFYYKKVRPKNENTKNQINARRLIIERKEGGLLGSLSTHLFYQDLLGRIAPNNKEIPENVSSEYLYSARSHYSITLASFSRGIWMINEKPIFIENNPINITKNHKRLSDLEKELGITREESVKCLSGFNRNYCSRCIEY